MHGEPALSGRWDVCALRGRVQRGLHCICCNATQPYWGCPRGDFQHWSVFVAAATVCSPLQKLEKHYVPLAELFRGHWLGLILQTGYEAWIGTCVACWWLGVTLSKLRT